MPSEVDLDGFVVGTLSKQMEWKDESRWNGIRTEELKKFLVIILR